MRILIDGPFAQTDLCFATASVQKAVEALRSNAGGIDLQKDKLGSIAINCTLRPSQIGLKDPRLYHATAIVYAWVEFCWDDIERDESNRFFAEDEPIESGIDWLARKYGIQRRDHHVLPTEMMFRIIYQDA
jgi:hypothetical protein